MVIIQRVQIALLSFAFSLSFLSDLQAAEICSPTNQWGNNCVGPKPPLPPNGWDQGRISHARKHHFQNVTIPQFQIYKNANDDLNRKFNLKLTNDAKTLGLVFENYFLYLKIWHTHSLSSFSEYFGSNDLQKVANDHKVPLRNKFKELITEKLKYYVSQYALLKKDASVQYISFNYWAKAYLYAVSGHSGFEPAWNYSDGYDNYRYADFVYAVNGPGYDYVNQKSISDYWNNAATQPILSIRVDRQELSPNYNFFDHIIATYDRQVDALLEKKVGPSELDIAISYVIDFNSTIFQSTLIGDPHKVDLISTYINFSAFDNQMKDEVLDIIFFKNKSTAVESSIALAILYYKNIKDSEYKSRIKKLASEILKEPWAKEESKIKNFISALESGNEDAYKIILNDDYIKYVFEENTIKNSFWNDNVEIGGIRPYLVGDELRLLESKIKGVPSKNNLYYPKERKSNRDWTYKGILITSSDYRKFIVPEMIKNSPKFNSFTQKGDVHHFLGGFYTPRFEGNSSDLGYYYPDKGVSDEHWDYIGDETKPSESFYYYVAHTLRNHKVLTNSLMLWGTLVSNRVNNIEYISSLKTDKFDLENKLKNLISGLSDEASSYVYTPLDPYVLAGAKVDFQTTSRLGAQFDTWVTQNIDALEDFNNGYIPNDMEILTHWSQGRWSPPEGWNEWYIEAQDKISPSMRVLSDSIRGVREMKAGVSVHLDNSVLIHSINNMALIPELTAATVSMISLSTILTTIILI